MRSAEFKSRLKRNFDRSASTYDQAAWVQKECAQLLAGLLVQFTNNTPDKILDIGTGTGYLAEKLLLHFPQSTYLLNDIAPEMLREARFKFADCPNVHFLEGDAETHCFGHHSLIASNLAFQWFFDFKKAIHQLFHQSNILAFSTLLDGTFEEWTRMHENLNLPTPAFPYPSEEALKNDCLNLKPKRHFFLTQSFNLTFDSPLAFAKYLKQLGAQTSHQEYSSYHLRKIKKNNHSPIITNYKVFFALLKRA